MKPFAVYSLLKYLQRIVKIFSKNYPHLCFFNMGCSDQIFSQFLKIIFNNAVIKFAKFFKNSQAFLRKCTREKLLKTSESPCISDTSLQFRIPTHCKNIVQLIIVGFKQNKPHMNSY